mmetsp:Transcript_100179/g.312124  ORF Transcript_100179/g.312124 Transcript_100179/m.312124 type:complete len:239 (-) Transcript_100179:116-832(-)
MAKAAGAGHAPSVQELLSEAHAAEQRRRISLEHATADARLGSGVSPCDTVSFQVVDAQGNAVSVVDSIFSTFGAGIVPTGCGFALQNRGAAFVLRPEDHPNLLEGSKRPYHTLIPSMCLRGGELYCTFTNMGGFMQPQGQVQNLLNLIAFGMDPQRSVDAPRFCIGAAPFSPPETVFLEEGIDEGTVERLRAMGHAVQVVSGHDRALFGRAQIILRHPATGALWGGSDGRGDGLAIGF